MHRQRAWLPATVRLAVERRLLLRVAAVRRGGPQVIVVGLFLLGALLPGLLIFRAGGRFFEGGRLTLRMIILHWFLSVKQSRYYRPTADEALASEAAGFARPADGRRLHSVVFH